MGENAKGYDLCEIRASVERPEKIARVLYP